MDNSTITMSEAKWNDLSTTMQILDDVMYSGWLPTTGFSSHTFFADGAANGYLTNILNPGKLPFTGYFRMLGIGMIINPMLDPAYYAAKELCLEGWAKLKIGSNQAIVLQFPLNMLFGQKTCCTAGGSPTAAIPLQTVSTSQFCGKNGFLALPNGPVFDQDTYFQLEVNWNTAWVGTQYITPFFYLFGKSARPLVN